MNELEFCFLEMPEAEEGKYWARIENVRIAPVKGEQKLVVSFALFDDEGNPVMEEIWDILRFYFHH